MLEPNRLREMMTLAGVSQTDLARRIGVSQGAIGHLVTGRTNASKYLHRIARELGTTAAYLEGEIDDPTFGAAVVPTATALAEQLDAVMVRSIDAVYGLGGGFIDDANIVATPMAFPRAWLRLFTHASADLLFFARGDGDSMEPTIMRNDIVLIDGSETVINRRDQIWAIAMGQIGSIKRIRAAGDGSFTIMSDNPSVSDDTAADDEEMKVIGLVVAIVRGMR